MSLRTPGANYFQLTACCYKSRRLSILLLIVTPKGHIYLFLKRIGPRLFYRSTAAMMRVPARLDIFTASALFRRSGGDDAEHIYRHGLHHSATVYAQEFQPFLGFVIHQHFADSTTFCANKVIYRHDQPPCLLNRTWINLLKAGPIENRGGYYLV